MSQITTSNPNTGTVTVMNGDGSITILPGSPLAPYTGYPVIPTKFAKENFTRKNLDNTISNETDGGYEYTRPRNKNFKRRDYTLGYSMIPNSELGVLRNWQEDIGNCGGIFTWVDPTNQEMYLCRLTDTLSEVYAGFSAGQSIWNVTFKLRTIRLLSSSYIGYLVANPQGPNQFGQNFTSVYLSQLLQPGISQLLLFVNGVLQNLPDIIIDQGGYSATLINSASVDIDDDITAFAIPLTSLVASYQVPTVSGASTGGLFYQLTLTATVDPTLFYPIVFVNGLAQPTVQSTIDTTGNFINLLGFGVRTVDKIQVAFYSIPWLCTVVGNVDGRNASFTISPALISFLFVFINGLLQNPSTYTVSGNSLNLSQAPPNGSDLRVYTL